LYMQAHMYNVELCMSCDGACAGMNACIAVGKIEEARDLLERMHSGGFNPDVRSYNILLKGYARIGDTEGMQDLVMQMRGRGVEPSPTSYNTLVDAYVRKCDLSEVCPVLVRGEDMQLFGSCATRIEEFVSA
jgi:pentatricopeptide repeat protein